MTMKKILTILMLLPALAHAGARYTYGPTTDGVTISATSTTPNLVAGDTLDIQATALFNAVSFTNLAGADGNYIVIRFLPGSALTTSNTGYAGVWTNVHHVKILDMYAHDYLGTPVVFSNNVHDIIFETNRFINDGVGGFSEKQAIKFSDPSETDMDFNGTKASTFYNVLFDHCTFDGFKNVSSMVFGGNTENSICTDIEIRYCTYKRYTNTGHVTVNAMQGTVFNFNIHHNTFDSLLYNVMGNEVTFGVHAGAINLAGWGEIHHNRFDSSYTQPLRMEPMRWNVFNYGNFDTAKLYIHDNLSTRALSFSFAEISNNNSAVLFGNIDADTARTIISYNTVYKTYRASYNGDYHGCIGDVISKFVSVYNNVIISPEQDRTWNPDASNSRYVVAFISGTPYMFDSSGNRQFRTAAEAGFDSVNMRLLSTSPLIQANATSDDNTTTDFYDQVKPGGISPSMTNPRITNRKNKLSIIR
jgi:hypothetical protein